jgi:CSLREA domain-containing protein
MELYARRRGIGSTSLLAALLIVATTPLLAPAPAQAADDVVTETPTITVNTTVDTPDANPGNGTCADAWGSCSLRAAIEESNAKPGPQNVTVPAGTYLLSSQLVVGDDLTVNGAGKDATFIDGNNASRVLHVRTDELLVCDSGNNSVASYDRNGQPNPDFLASGAGGMDLPNTIGLDSDGNVFVAALESGVHRFSQDGTSPSLWLDPATPGLANFAPTDLVVADHEAPGSNLYVTDYHPNKRVLVAHHDSNNVIPLVNAGTGGLQEPNSLAFFNQDLYVTSVSSHQVLRYNGSTGAFVEVFVDGLNSPRDLIFHNGMLYVANQANDEVRRYNAETGQEDASAFVTAGSGGLDGPTDLAFGPDGDLYVISSGTQDVLRYNGSTGAFRGVFINGGSALLNDPSCLRWRYGAGAGPNVTISGVTIQNGNTTIAQDRAAGLMVSGGATVALRSSVVRDNDSGIFGGGIGNYGELSLFEVEVRNNTVPVGTTGGQTASGGGIYNQGKLTIGRSLLADNVAQRGGGINNNGSGQINIVNTTISGNIAYDGGGGIRQVGGLININASTITNNYANQSRAVNGTVGKDPFGGGILITETGRVAMANTILAGNSDNREYVENGYSPDCYSLTPRRFTSRRDNLVGVLTTNCVLKDMLASGPLHDQVGTPGALLDPELTWLGYYDSDIRVHKLRSNSPALDADQYEGSNRFFKCPATDQRGVARPQNGACDIGAFELIQGVGGDRPDDGDITDEPRPDPNAPRSSPVPTARPGATTAPATPTAAADTTTAPATATTEATGTYSAAATPVAP